MFELNVTIRKNNNEEIKTYKALTAGDLVFAILQDVSFSEREEDGKTYHVFEKDVPAEASFQRTLIHKLKRRKNFFVES